MSLLNRFFSKAEIEHNFQSNDDSVTLNTTSGWKDVVSVTASEGGLYLITGHLDASFESASEIISGRLKNGTNFLQTARGTLAGGGGLVFSAISQVTTNAIIKIDSYDAGNHNGKQYRGKLQIYKLQ